VGDTELPGSGRSGSQAEPTGREGEARFRAAFEGAAHGIALVSSEGRWLMVNRALCALLGYTEAEMLAADFQSLTHPDDLEADLALVRRTLAGEIDRYELEKRYLHKEGRVIPTLLTVSLVRDERGAPRYFVSQVIDLTRLRETESRLAEAQRLELVGQLTGGVAHDFNNLLTIVMANLDLLRLRVGDDPDKLEPIDAATHAAQRGAELTGSLLAFARRQPLAPSLVDPNLAIERLRPLIERTLPDDVGLRTDLGHAGGSMSVDPAQLESALLNLAVNARDAMAGAGGTLTVRTRDIEVATGGGHPPEVEPGRWVVIEVRDEGCGMSPETARSAVEPFFTTKGPGKGSGLGLSMVFGFVRQSGGHMTIESREGEGTCVRLYFPHLDREAAPPTSPEKPSEPSGDRRGTVLVAEDETDVRRTVSRFLASLGYRVLEASSAEDALEGLEAEPAVDLLFSDMVMPGRMDGAELAREARRRHPDIAVLLTSGYARSARRSGGLESRDEWIPKPYRLPDLGARIDRLLEARRRTRDERPDG
jgi:PAS domain S-box-containing protein